MTTTQLPEAWNPKKPTLFSLSQEMVELDALLTESAGELTPEVEAWFDANREAMADKVDAVAWFIRTCEAREAGYQKVMDDLKAKQQTERNKVTQLKQYARACMDLLGTRKLEGEVYTFAIQKNGGKAPLKLLAPYDTEPDKLPAEFVTWLPKADTQALRLAAEQGRTEGIAVIEPVGEHVRLR